MSVSFPILVGSVSAALAAGLLVRILFPPPKRLRSRLVPYINPSVVPEAPVVGGPLRQIFGPPMMQLASALGRLMERSGDRVTIDRIRQAGWYRDVPESQMISAYRVAQLRAIVIGVFVGLALGQLLSPSLWMRVGLVVLGLVIGSTRHRGALLKAIEARKELMRIEIYTVNQLLAMRVRAGGGVVNAVQAIVERGQGEVVGELSDALRLHRAGWRAGDAFRRIAELAPEPFCGRTYRLLASAEERGADLAGALLDLSEDVRETRRESIKRSSTKRRAAMLVPTIAILAPVMILFVAAPLPYLITGWQ